MRAIKNYTLDQALNTLHRANQKLGNIYLPDDSIINRYIYYYVPIIYGFEHLFSQDSLDREELLTNQFILKNNPTCDKNFRIGENVFSNVIEVYNNAMDQSEVDLAITQFVENFDKLEVPENSLITLHIGGSEEDPDRANATPSKEVIDLAGTIVDEGNAEITYWDGLKNVTVFNPKLRIETSDDYQILDVSSTFSGKVKVNSEQNLFFMKKEMFERFALLMNGVRYAESNFKCCVLFDDNLNILDVYNKPNSEEEIFLNGYSLAYAPLDFFMEAITLPELGDPIMDVWNRFIEKNSLGYEKRFIVFPNIDLSPLN